MSSILSYTHYTNGSPTYSTALILHGIFGQGRNMATFAKSLLVQHPNWGFVTVDLRNHGNSQGFLAPHTLEACAQDLLELESHLGISFHAVIGHSFGGKVALEYAHQQQTTKNSVLQQVWVLDSIPGALIKPIVTSPDSITYLISVLAQVQMPIDSRKRLTDTLLERGISKKVALWMTTNLKETPEGLVWCFELSNIIQMLKSYAAADYWGLLEQPSPVSYHIVYAEHSERWELAMLDRLKKSFSISHLLVNSGHWVHSDNLPGLLKIMQPYF